VLLIHNKQVALFLAFWMVVLTSSCEGLKTEQSIKADLRDHNVKTRNAALALLVPYAERGNNQWAIDKVREILMTGPKEDRIQMLSYIGGMGNQEKYFEKDVVHVLNDNDPEIRTTGIIALEMIKPKDSSSLEALLNLLNDNNDEVRLQCFTTLQRVSHDTRVIKALIGALINEPKESLRSNYVLIFLNYEGYLDNYIDDFIILLSDPNQPYVYDILFLLGRLGNKASKALESIRQLAQSKDERLRQAAEEAIRNIERLNESPR